MSEYTKRAEEFCERNHVKMDFRFKGCLSDERFWGDSRPRNTYEVFIEREGKMMSITFHDSLHNTEKGIKPTAYDVLSCLTKYEVEDDVWDFAQEFGFDIHDKESYKAVSETHKACQKEYNDVVRVFGDVLDELQEIE